jgi:hypothetical protein
MTDAEKRDSRQDAKTPRNKDPIIRPFRSLLWAFAALRVRCEPGKGLPIGNLNSQFFANVYLNGLDQFVKQELRCRHYVRYCDDFVLLSADRDQLVAWRGISGIGLDAVARKERQLSRPRKHRPCAFDSPRIKEPRAGREKES